jgi:hypothetical protein
MSTTVETTTEIRPFRAEIPQEEIEDLRRRLAATRWPEKETDPSQGVELAKLKELVEYWATDYDWRKAEQKLNALPQFTTEIDGLDIHFIHVRSPHEDAMPMIVTQGWLMKRLGYDEYVAQGGDLERGHHRDDGPASA